MATMTNVKKRKQTMVNNIMKQLKLKAHDTEPLVNKEQHNGHNDQEKINVVNNIMKQLNLTRMTRNRL